MENIIIDFLKFIAITIIVGCGCLFVNWIFLPKGSTFDDLMHYEIDEDEDERVSALAFFIPLFNLIFLFLLIIELIATFFIKFIEKNEVFSILDSKIKTYYNNIKNLKIK